MVYVHKQNCEAYESPRGNIQLFNFMAFNSKIIDLINITSINYLGQLLPHGTHIIISAKAALRSFEAVTPKKFSERVNF